MGEVCKDMDSGKINEWKMERLVTYSKYGQIKSLETKKPYYLRIGKKWMIIRDLKDVERALKLRDKLRGKGELS